MKKKVFATLLAVSMIASMVPAAVSVQAADGDSIRLVNGKIEVDAQLKKLAEMYEKETGTKVEIESMGGGIDIQGTLKGYYQSETVSGEITALDKTGLDELPLAFQRNGNGICRCGYCPHLKAGSHGFYPFDGNTFV